MKKVLLWGGLFLMMAVIFAFSMQPGKKSTETSEGVTGQIIKIFPGSADTGEGLPEKVFKKINFYVRKSAHFICYLLLGILATAAMQTTHFSNRKKVIFALLICLLFATSDEFHQLFVPGRSGEVRDVCLDFAGSAVGTFLACSFLYLKKRRRLRSEKQKI